MAQRSLDVKIEAIRRRGFFLQDDMGMELNDLEGKVGVQRRIGLEVGQELLIFNGNDSLPGAYQPKELSLNPLSRLVLGSEPAHPGLIRREVKQAPLA